MRNGVLHCAVIVVSTLAGTIACSASGPIATLFKSTEQQAAVAPTAAETLPAVRAPRPFRQRANGNCSLPAPNPPGVCRFAFDEVPANRLLEIANVNCVSGTANGGIYVLAKAGNYTKLIPSVYAAIPKQQDTNIGMATGPFFIPAGERLYIWADGAPETGSFCTIQGTLYRTD